MRILIIEDDAKTADFISRGLNEAGFRACCAADGLDGLFKAKSEPFDAAVVDIMLPKTRRPHRHRRDPAARLRLPIIVLSARDSVESKIKGARERRRRLSGEAVFVLRAARPNPGADPPRHRHERTDRAYRPRPFTGPDPTESHRRNVPIELQPLEFQLLEYLMRNTGRVVSKTTILEHVWEYNFDTQTNIVEAGIFRLREKIDKPFDDKMIRTVRGFGYVLE